MPASAWSGEAGSADPRLAEVFTVVSSVAVLSEVSGSNTPEVVLAVLEKFGRASWREGTARVVGAVGRDGIVVRVRRTTASVRARPQAPERKLLRGGRA